MTKEDIVTKVVLEYFNNHIQDIKYNNNTGYSHEYIGTFSQKIGSNFIKNNIPFESNFDIGYGNEIDPKDKEFSLYYKKICKITPTDNFLKNILSIDFQKETLNKTIEILNISDSLQDFSRCNSVLHIFRDYGQIGLDKMLINSRITDIIKYSFNKSELHANIITSYIHNGFFFDEEFMKKVKINYLKTFSNKGEEDFSDIYENNKKNMIKYVFNELNSNLENKTTVKIKKNKI